MLEVYNKHDEHSVQNDYIPNYLAILVSVHNISK